MDGVLADIIIIVKFNDIRTNKFGIIYKERGMTPTLTVRAMKSLAADDKNGSKDFRTTVC